VPTALLTPRLVIRSFEPGDAEAWVEMVSDDRVTRYLPPGPTPTLESFASVLERRRAMEDEIGYSMWAVEERASKVFVGQCGIRPVDEGNGPEIDLAYHFRPEYWNRGFGTESAVAVLTHGLGTLGLGTIMAVVVPENIGSWRVMEHAGMRLIGLVDYYGLVGVKKYEAQAGWWRPPSPRDRSSNEASRAES
jgi:RimJ/RimL family protein N-acetyltransferase